jgi:hypothetical protein
VKNWSLYGEREREELRGRGVKPAPWVDELEPEAMAMGGGEVVGMWWRRRFPSALREP